MSPNTTLATLATGVFSKLSSYLLPVTADCGGRTSEAPDTSVPSYITGRTRWPALASAAFTCCGWRGRMSSERTLSSTSMSELSPELMVAELQDASRPTDSNRKAAPMLRPTVGDRPGLPTRTMFSAIPVLCQGPRAGLADHSRGSTQAG